MKQNFHTEEIEGQSRLRTVLSWAVNLAVVVTLALFVVMMFGDRVTVAGRSMEPELASDDVVLLNKLWYNFGKPKRMDVVAFTGKDNAEKVYVKRIVGLPGETVEIRGGSLYIDGTEMPLPGDGRLMAAGLAEAGVTLGEGEYFVLGDDPETSEDSRFANVGSVERNQILGKVWFRISPLSRLGFVN